MKSMRILRRGQALWLAQVCLTGVALLVLSGCGHSDKSPASLDQMRQDAKGGPIPESALKSYMASHPGAVPNPNSPPQKPPGQ